MNILLIALIVILGQSVCGQTCNSAGLRKFDQTIAKLITVGNSGRRFPESKGTELKQYCDESAQLILDIDGYKERCLFKASRQVTGVLIYAIRNTVKQFCKKDSKQLNKLITANQCANLGNTEIHKCYAQMIDSFLGIQNEQDNKKKLPYLCCEYFKLFPCIENRLQRINKCDASKVTTITDFVRSIVGNLIDLFCMDYTEGSDKCNKLGSPPRKRKTQRRTLSFALPMIDVLKSLPEN